MRGKIEGIYAGVLRGWAWDEQAPDETLQLQIVVDGTLAGRVKADHPRGDLRAAGIGDPTVIKVMALLQGVLQRGVVWAHVVFDQGTVNSGVLPDGRGCPANEPADRRLQSGNVMPEPPISAGKSFILGSPSFTLSTFSP